MDGSPVAAAHPQGDRHDGEIGGNEHRARHVRPDADEPSRLHQQVEEEALMQMLQQIVQAPAYALHCPAKGHFIMPTLAFGLQRDGVDVVGDKTAMSTGCQAQTLSRHASEHCLKSLSVTVIMLPHLLQTRSDAHLIVRDNNGSIEQIQIRELAIHTVIDDVQRLKAVIERIFNHHATLQRSTLQGQRLHRWRMQVMIRVDPCLRPGFTVWRDQEDYIFGPE